MVTKYKLWTNYENDCFNILFCEDKILVKLFVMSVFMSVLIVYQVKSSNIIIMHTNCILIIYFWKCFNIFNFYILYKIVNIITYLFINKKYFGISKNI